jgi:hypothetical protein
MALTDSRSVFNRVNEVVASYILPSNNFHSSMTGIVILPAGRDDAFEDYKQFIRDGHPIEDIESYLNTSMRFGD